MPDWNFLKKMHYFSLFLCFLRLTKLAPPPPHQVCALGSPLWSTSNPPTNIDTLSVGADHFFGEGGVGLVNFSKTILLRKINRESSLYYPGAIYDVKKFSHKLFPTKKIMIKLKATKKNCSRKLPTPSKKTMPRTFDRHGEYGNSSIR